MNEKEKMYMNPYTGSVDVLENWDCCGKDQDLDELIEVKLDEEGHWVEA